MRCVVINQAIASGLTLLDLSSPLCYIAVIVDSLARRLRASHGPA